MEMNEELRSILNSNSNSKKLLSFVSDFLICILFLFLTFSVALVKAEASSSNQNSNHVNVYSQVKVCSEIFSNSEQQLNFEKGLHALAKRAARVILENTGRPHDMQRDMLLEKINIEAKAHIKTEEHRQLYGQLILKYQKELRAEINQKQQAESEKEKRREEKLKEQEREAREKNHPVNVISKAKLIFHEIEPGSFDMNYEVYENENYRYVRKTIPVTLTKSYALAQYQTTQMQWAYLKILMGERDPEKINPSEFKEGPNSISVNFDLKNGDRIKIKLQPDNPVEKVSWNEVIEWIKGLNNLSKNGDEYIQKELKRVVPGHIKGDVYALPTEAQWAYVMQSRGKNSEIHFDREDENDLQNYALYHENSEVGSYKGTHEVGSKQARKIDRGDGIVVDFHDLEGNVWEWNNDLYDKNPSGGTDPQGGVAGSKRVFRGGGWDVYVWNLRSGFRHSGSPVYSARNVGFRLARTRLTGNSYKNSSIRY